MDAVREIAAMFGAICGFVLLFILACVAFVVWSWRRKNVYGGRSVESAVAHAAVELSAADFEFPDFFD